jgi:hypothetical protein
MHRKSLVPELSLIGPISRSTSVIFSRSKAEVRESGSPGSVSSKAAYLNKIKILISGWLQWNSSGARSAIYFVKLGPYHWYGLHLPVPNCYLVPPLGRLFSSELPLQHLVKSLNLVRSSSVRKSISLGSQTCRLPP